MVLDNVLDCRHQRTWAWPMWARVCPGPPAPGQEASQAMALRGGAQPGSWGEHKPQPHLFSPQHSCLLKHGRLAICAFNV